LKTKGAPEPFYDLSALWHINPMPKIAYRVLIRKNERTCDVEMRHGRNKPRIVNTFNSEAEAWGWINEQKQINKFAYREVEEGRGKRSDKRDGN